MEDEENERVERIDGELRREFGQMQIREAILNEEERTLTVSFSSEEPYTRKSFFEDPWVEVLGHKRDEVNMSRLESGAPVLYNHLRSGENRIGVVESAKITKKRGTAVIRISKREEVAGIWQDIQDGILRNVSVGYTIDERKLTREGKAGEPDEYRVSRWTPHEISLVDIPADTTVGVGRSEDEPFLYRVIDLTPTKETRTVDPEEETTNTDPAPNAPAPATRTQPVSPNPEELANARAAGVEEGAELERTRQSQITDIFAPFPGHSETRDLCISQGHTVDQARAALLDAMGNASNTPAGGDATGGTGTRYEVTENESDKFIRGAQLFILEQGGMLRSEDDKKEARELGLRGFSLYEMARRCLEYDGVRTLNMNKMELVGRAFTSSDFPQILLDASNKSMLNGYEEAPETWNIWCSTGSFSDFKVNNEVNLSSFNDLQQVNEDGEFTYGKFQDEKQTIQLATYGKLFAITRQAIINDDLGAFTRIPMLMGRAAARLVGDLAYGVLTTNGNLSDGVALFAGTSIGTSHGNLNIGGAAALASAPLQQMRTAMGRQSDISGNATALNIRPAYLLAPMALEDTARQQMSSEFVPEEGATTSVRKPNTIRNMAEVVTDARLDADSTTRYYLGASQQFDTVKIGFLDGVQAPVLEEQSGWTRDGREMKVRIDCGAAAMDYRSWQRNDGA